MDMAAQPREGCMPLPFIGAWRHAIVFRVWVRHPEETILDTRGGPRNSDSVLSWSPTSIGRSRSHEHTTEFLS